MWIVLVFPKKKARIHKNERNSWTFRFGPFFGWFAGRLPIAAIQITGIPVAISALFCADLSAKIACCRLCRSDPPLLLLLLIPQKLRCLGARDSNQDPLANRAARIESRDLNNLNVWEKIVKTSQRIERNLGSRFESCDFKSLRPWRP